jgi:hypothetical protein
MQNPTETLGALGRFIDHDLDYASILRAGIGTVSQPESSFRGAISPRGFNPVGRWRQKYSARELAQFESLVGDFLEDLGYTLATNSSERRRGLPNIISRAFFAWQIESIHWLKGRRALRRLVGTRAAAMSAVSAGLWDQRKAQQRSAVSPSWTKRRDSQEHL